MHELGLAQGILDVVLGVAGDRPVRRVRVSVGALQRVDADSLEMGFRLAAEGSGAADARLEVVSVPARLRCSGCGLEGILEGGVLACSACGSSSVEVLSGDSVLVDEIELAGTPPEVVRRPGLEVEEPGGEHDHDHDLPASPIAEGRGNQTV